MKNNYTKTKFIETIKNQQNKRINNYNNDNNVLVVLMEVRVDN